MAIKIQPGQALPTTSERKITYRDLHLDLQEQEKPRNMHMYGSTTLIDLQISVDEGAIMNSLKNIFTTTPGEKILDPEFGLNLSRWLFQPASDFTAQEIGEAIVQGIERYEPRVKLKTVNVSVQYEKNQYTIDLVLTIPSLNIIEKTYTGILHQPGFDFLTENN